MPVQSGIGPGRPPALRLAILGRDGVINERFAEGVRVADDWRAIPGSLRAIGRLISAHFHLVVAINQPGIDGSRLAQIHAKMNNEAAREGGRIGAIYHCPHSAGDGCACRIPRPDLLLDMAARLDIDLRDTPFIGDSLVDIDAARTVGARPILLRSGRGRVAEGSGSSLAGVEIYDDLAAAASVLIGQVGSD